MALEIIGAGFGRTGTCSLKAALERLGFGPCHHMSEVINTPDQVRLWSEVAKGHADFEGIFAGFRSAVDFPVAACWQEVLAVTPGAKVSRTPMQAMKDRHKSNPHLFVKPPRNLFGTRQQTRRPCRR